MAIGICVHTFLVWVIRVNPRSRPGDVLRKGSPCILLVLLAAAILSGCGGGAGSGIAGTNATAVASVSAGPTPFIAFVDLSQTDIGTISRIGYIIKPKPGTFSKPVSVRFSAAYLKRAGYASSGSMTVRVPVFGLYPDYVNSIDLDLKFNDGSARLLPVTISTAPYTGSLYGTPLIRVSRSTSDDLGFSFFYMKNSGTPVIADTDGNVRWTGDGSLSSFSSAWYENGFVVGAQSGPAITRYELDGRTTTSQLSEPRFLNFHHNVDIGVKGLLGEFDQALAKESTIAEFDQSGVVGKEWDMARIISDYMRANGDDPNLFVIPTADWFHSNAVAYDKRDRSMVVSSRENFLIKIDYASGRIIWIFGDPTKYWYTFSSLRAKAITLKNGLYPIGQHAVSITPQGYLQVFNDGLQSLNQPAGTPAGNHRGYSSVSTYSIDEKQQTAAEVTEVSSDRFRGISDVAEFDYGDSILSNVCSSAYSEKDGSMLIDYAVAAPGSPTPVQNNLPYVVGNSARLVGLNPSRNIAFDFEYPTVGCATSFNANVVHLESLEFD